MMQTADFASRSEMFMPPAVLDPNKDWTLKVEKEGKEEEAREAVTNGTPAAAPEAGHVEKEAHQPNGSYVKPEEAWERAKKAAADRQAEQLKHRRRQDEVSKARMMAEVVGEEERKELQDMFPELLETQGNERQRNDYFLDDSDEDGLPKAYVFIGPSVLETVLGGDESELDFGLSGLNIHRRDFVGLRPIKRFSKPPPLPINFVPGPSRLTQGIERAKELASSLGGTVKGSLQWIAEKRPFGGTAQKKMGTDEGPATVNGTAGHSPGPSGAPAAAATNVGERASPSAGSRAESAAVVAEEPQLDPYAQIKKWEIVWKDPYVQGTPVRRLEFGCNDAGVTALTQKLAAWQHLATSAAALVEASQAALKANGGHLPENPGVWLPSGLPEIAETFFKQKQGEAAKDEHEQEHVVISEEGEGNEGHANGVPPTSTSETSGEEDKDCVIRWGSVSVVGRFMPKTSAHSLILKPGHFKALAVALPARLRTNRWELLYSTARDGISLHTLYRKLAAKKGPCLLIIKDGKKHVFGSFTNEEWKPLTRYYGNGECFVFQVEPELTAFRWTHSNSYFMFSTPNSLAIGGGDHYAFSLNSDLLSGYSGQCETFGSISLAGSEEFEAAIVEVWGFR